MKTVCAHLPCLFFFAHRAWAAFLAYPRAARRSVSLPTLSRPGVSREGNLGTLSLRLEEKFRIYLALRIESQDNTTTAQQALEKQKSDALNVGDEVWRALQLMFTRLLCQVHYSILAVQNSFRRPEPINLRHDLICELDRV